jgi:hypothetical protein
MTEAARVMFITSEMLGHAWYSKSGRESDDDQVTLPDGSRNLSYDPKTKQIRTWNEREGVKPQAVAASGAGYTVSYREDRTAVRPRSRFATVDLLFAKEPTERVAYESTIAEIRKAIQKSGGKLPITAYANVGPKDNPAAQRGVRGADGQIISVKFEPSRPTLRNLAGHDIGLAR